VLEAVVRMSNPPLWLVQYLELYNRLAIILPEPSLDHEPSARDIHGGEADAEEMKDFIGMLGAGFPSCLKHRFPDEVLSTFDLNGQNFPLEAGF
jgi:hypothetical protein